MHITKHEADVWDTLRGVLTDDPSAYARYLEQNLSNVQEQVNAHNGQLIAVMETLYPYRFVGAVSLSKPRDGVVMVHFYYICDEFWTKYSEVLKHLLHAVHECSEADDYAYVYITLPAGHDCGVPHSEFFQCSVACIDDVTATGHEVVVYCVPKVAFLGLCF